MTSMPWDTQVGKQKIRPLLLGLVFCHGAHSGEERGTRDKDKLKITVFNSEKAGQDKAGLTIETPGVTSRPDNTN